MISMKLNGGNFTDKLDIISNLLTLSDHSFKHDFLTPFLRCVLHVVHKNFLFIWEMPCVVKMSYFANTCIVLIIFTRKKNMFPVWDSSPHYFLLVWDSCPHYFLLVWDLCLHSFPLVEIGWELMELCIRCVKLQEFSFLFYLKGSIISFKALYRGL